MALLFRKRQRKVLGLLLQGLGNHYLPKLRFPIPQNVGFNARNLANFPDFIVEFVGN